MFGESKTDEPTERQQFGGQLCNPQRYPEGREGVSFEVQEKQITAIIGESGSGKSVSCYALLGLIPSLQAASMAAPPVGGRDLLTLSENELREIRGRDIAR